MEAQGFETRSKTVQVLAAPKVQGEYVGRRWLGISCTTINCERGIHNLERRRKVERRMMQLGSIPELVLLQARG